MARRQKKVREKKPKKVSCKVIDRMHAGKPHPAYALMDAMIAKHHGHLTGAKITLAWGFGWRAVDDRPRLVAVKKGDDLLRDKKFADADFVILINADMWPQLGDERQPAAMEHALCHCEIVRTKDGEPKEDDNGRTVYRLRQPDIREFTEVVSRHGCYTGGLARFVAQANKLGHRPLLAREEEELRKVDEAELKANAANVAKANANAAEGKVETPKANGNGHAATNGGPAAPKNRIVGRG